MAEEKQEKQEKQERGKGKGRPFYYGSDQTLKDAGSFSFFTPLGTRVETNEGIDSTLAKSSVPDIIPGIAVVDYEYVPGLSTDGASPINIASKKLYTFVRHQNSGSRNYDSPDLTNYCYSVGSAYTFIAQLQRVYGLIKLYSAKNRYLGMGIVQALGFDYFDLSKNLAAFRQLINIAALKLNALKVPADWPAVTRQWLFNSCVLKDGDIDKSQLYAFRNTVMWQYNETGTYVGCLTPVQIFGTAGVNLLTISAIDVLLNTVINALVASEDVNIMSGDILKAYGDKVLNIGPISEDYAIAPIWNEDMLQIFHNLQFIAPSETYGVNPGTGDPFLGNIIWQDTVNNCIMFKPIPVHSQGVDYEETAGGFRYSVDMSNGVIDSTKDDPDPYAVMNMMSAKVLVDVTDIISGNSSGTYITFGTELFTGLRFYAQANNTAPTTGFSRDKVYYAGTYGFTNVSGGGYVLYPEPVMWLLNMASCFDWAPRLVLCGGMDNTGGSRSVPYVSRIGDLYNFSKFETADAVKCHTAQILAGFGIA